MDLSGSIANLETLFKSEDGKLKLVIKKKDDGECLLKVKIKEESQQSIKIKPKQTQFTPIDKDTLAIRFALDQEFLQRTPDPFINFNIVYNGPGLLNQLTCKECKEVISKDIGELRVKSAPSDNWQEVIGLWQCHKEKFDRMFDPITR